MGLHGTSWQMDEWLIPAEEQCLYDFWKQRKKLNLIIDTSRLKWQKYLFGVQFGMYEYLIVIWFTRQDWWKHITINFIEPWKTNKLINCL